MHNHVRELWEAIQNLWKIRAQIWRYSSNTKIIANIWEAAPTKIIWKIPEHDGGEFTFMYW